MVCYSMMAFHLKRGMIRRVSRRTGITPSHISRALRGERGLSTRTAQLLASELGVTVEELLRRIGPRAAKSGQPRDGANG